MRWFIYISTVFFIIILSFWTYLWSYRKEFIQHTLEQSYPGQFVIEKVSFPSLGDLVITNLKITPQDVEKPIVLQQVVVNAELKNWISWLLIPSQSPLKIDTITVVLPKNHSPQLLPTTNPLHLSVNELVILKDGNVDKIHNLHDCTDILNTVLQYNEGPKDTK